jgi:hypothetical protein
MRTWSAAQLGSFIISTRDHRMGPLFAFLALTWER